MVSAGSPLSTPFMISRGYWGPISHQGVALGAPTPDPHGMGVTWCWGTMWLKGPTKHYTAHMFQTTPNWDHNGKGLIPIRAINNISLLKISQNHTKICRWEWWKCAFVCKQMPVLVVHINIIRQPQWCFGRLIVSYHGLYFTTCMSWPDWLYFYC